VFRESGVAPSLRCRLEMDSTCRRRLYYSGRAMTNLTSVTFFQDRLFGTDDAHDLTARLRARLIFGVIRESFVDSASSV